MWVCMHVSHCKGLSLPTESELGFVVPGWTVDPGEDRGGKRMHRRRIMTDRRRESWEDARFYWKSLRSVWSQRMRIWRKAGLFEVNTLQQSRRWATAETQCQTSCGCFFSLCHLLRLLCQTYEFARHFSNPVTFLLMSRNWWTLQRMHVRTFWQSLMREKTKLKRQW